MIKTEKRLYDALTAYGYEMPKPEGAFYLFVKTPTENDLEFVEKIKEHRIFADTRQWVRLSRLCADCVLRCAGDHRRALPGFKAMMEYYKINRQKQENSKTHFSGSFCAFLFFVDAGREGEWEKMYFGGRWRELLFFLGENSLKGSTF